VHLPSGRVVTLEASVKAPRARLAKEPMFSELASLVGSGELTLTEKGAPLALTSLELRDFHALRAIATHLGWIQEDEVAFPCCNCGETVEARPCASMQTGPFVDGELGDPELDATLDLSVAHPIPPVKLRGGATAREVRLRRVTLGDAAALHRALRRRHLVLTEAVVRGLGVEALGDEKRPAVVADALSRCSDAAFAAVGDLFLRAHYPPRLGALVLCPHCGARNDVDAPYDREMEPSGDSPKSNGTTGEVFPDFDGFAAHAKATFDDVVGAAVDHVRLVVDDDVPACDDGGEPLLGSYEPPGGDVRAPVGTGAVTLYFRTFRAMWDEDGPYDWKAEVDETVEHELEHHAGWRAGSDPMDDDERAEIADERARHVGRRAVARQSVAALAADVRGFLARTWPIWLMVALMTLAAVLFDR
jgi:predicted RNA-binding Zn-ribbon protein involved in translation (DUF1610 family)